MSEPLNTDQKIAVLKLAVDLMVAGPAITARTGETALAGNHGDTYVKRSAATVKEIYGHLTTLIVGPDYPRVDGD